MVWPELYYAPKKSAKTIVDLYKEYVEENAKAPEKVGPRLRTTSTGTKYIILVRIGERVAAS